MSDVSQLSVSLHNDSRHELLPIGQLVRLKARLPEGTNAHSSVEILARDFYLAIPRYSYATYSSYTLL